MSGNPMAGWGTFYEIVGSAAGALVGIQFVIMALIASQGRRAKMEVIDAFGTPTVVHFCGALVLAVLAAVVTAPWPGPGGAAGVLAVLGAAYKAVVVRRTWRQSSYRPGWYDWTCYAGLPTAAYATVGVAGACLPGRPVGALFAVAAAAVGLLLIGIHNAWDTVTYLVTDGPAGGGPPAGEAGARPDPAGSS